MIIVPFKKEKPQFFWKKMLQKILLVSHYSKKRMKRNALQVSLVSDLRITTQGYGSCMGGETSFGSDPKEVYISYLQSPPEPQNAEENKATPLRCEPEYLVEEQATKVYVQKEDKVNKMNDKSSDFCNSHVHL